MFNLQSLRNAQRLSCLVLVWFALLVGSSAASPLVSPKGMQWVCTTAGSVKLLQLDADGQEVQGNQAGLHCALCWQLATPLVVSDSAPLPVELSGALHCVEQRRLSTLIGPPWQARAPPSFS